MLRTLILWVASSACRRAIVSSRASDPISRAASAPPYSAADTSVPASTPRTAGQSAPEPTPIGILPYPCTGSYTPGAFLPFAPCQLRSRPRAAPLTPHHAGTEKWLHQHPGSAEEPDRQRPPRGVSRPDLVCRSRKSDRAFSRVSRGYLGAGLP